MTETVDNDMGNRPLMPTLEVGVITVFDQVVPDGTNVEVEIDNGPTGGMLLGTMEPTVAGTARFDSRRANLPGVYRMRARAGRAQLASTVDIIIPPDSLFNDGFE